MSCISHTRDILMRDGTNQYERLLDALKPSFVLVDERSREDLMRFVEDFALLVQYYNESNARDGDWEAFFNDFRRSYEPHVALMLTFLELYRRAQDHLNEFTLKHLEYYYKKILQIREKAAQPDSVHLIVELAKNVAQYKLEKGAQVKAGKDALGKELYYETESEIVVNKAQVESLKTIFVDTAPDGKLYAAPVANSADGQGEPLTGSEPRWFTFGKNQSDLFDTERTMIDGKIGFAVASPLLYLAEGSRTVTLKLQFHNLPSGSTQSLADILSKNYAGAFRAWFSGEKEWIGPVEVSVSKTTDNTGLQLILVIGPELDGVVAFDSATLKDAFDTKLPVIKILLDETKKPSPLHDLSSLRIKSLNLKVSVEGVANLILQNDLGKLDASKPFQPFGPAPVAGSNFYIGSSEAFNKRLDTLDLCFKWKDLPGSIYGFEGYYYVYDPTYKKYATSGYKAAVSALNKKSWIPASGQESMSLFDMYYSYPSYGYQQFVASPVMEVMDAGNPKKVKTFKKTNHAVDNMMTDISGEPMMMVAPFMEVQMSYIMFSYLSKGELKRQINVSKLNLTLDDEPVAIDELNNSVKNGFLKLELTGQDFGHKEYPAVHTLQAIELSKQVLDGGTGSVTSLPNPPYTPLMEYLRINYSASENISLEGAPTTAGSYFHIEPFGEYAVPMAKSGTGMHLLPQFTNEGYLYIGLRDLVPRQNISLLFQFAESSAASETFVDPGDLEWSYLSEDQWIGIKDQEIISDSTNGCLTSGIITLDIPKDATSANHLLPSDLFWIRLSAKQNALGVNQLIDVKSQAVTAVFKDNGNDPAHLTVALAAGTISKLVTGRPEVKKITQPYASFGGRPAESNQPFYEPFYTRVSERLRHKNRSVTIWDYERMVLQEFPKTYKVKCLSHSSEKNDISPGNITLVAIENIRNKNAVNPLQPKTSLDTLAKIKSFLEKSVSPFVRVTVQNPIYEEILVEFKVQFHPGYDAGYYQIQLNEEIKKFLSPWAYVEGEDIIFGNVIYKSSILNFIEKREYVDFITDFKMFHIKESWGIGCMEILDDFVVGDQDKSVDVDEARAKTSRSILVSAAEHDIYVLAPGEYVCEGVSA